MAAVTAHHRNWTMLVVQIPTEVAGMLGHTAGNLGCGNQSGLWSVRLCRNVTVTVTVITALTASAVPAVTSRTRTLPEDDGFGVCCCMCGASLLLLARGTCPLSTTGLPPSALRAAGCCWYTQEGQGGRHMPGVLAPRMLFKPERATFWQKLSLYSHVQQWCSLQAYAMCFSCFFP